MATFSSVRHVSVTIERRPADVYAFASKPENLSQWAAGLSSAIERVNGEWMADSPMGKVTVRFTEKNELGVLDHDVTLDSGATVHNPMRVVPNGDGSEVIFTLFQRSEISDEAFAADRAAVTRDLAKLKRLLERG